MIRQFNPLDRDIIEQALAQRIRKRNAADIAKLPCQDADDGPHLDVFVVEYPKVVTKERLGHTAREGEAASLRIETDKPALFVLADHDGETNVLQRASGAMPDRKFDAGRGEGRPQFFNPKFDVTNATFEVVHDDYLI